MPPLEGLLPPLLTREETAQLLRCTVRSLSNLPDLPAPFRAGRRVLYETAQIVAFLERNRATNSQGDFPP